MKGKYIISVLVFLLLATGGVSAQPRDEGQSVEVSDFVLVRDGGQVTVDFTLEIGSKAAMRANTLTVIPVLRSGELTRELTPVVIRGRRARILWERRRIASPRTTLMQESEMLTAANGETVEYHAVVPYEDWMAGSVLLLDGVDEGCCSAVRTNLGLVADNLMTGDVIDAGPKVMAPTRPLSTAERLAEIFPFVKPAGSGEVYSRDGITVHFRQGRHTIDPNYRGNRASLVDILSVVEQIQRSNDSQVESIVIAGFASPEGSYEHNMRLSERRAEAVRKFIYDNSNLGGNRLRIYAGGEDWEGLREMVAGSDMWDKHAVLDIIDNFPAWGYGGEARETALMRLRGGEAYRYMYHNFFPDLREAAYITVYFKNK